MEEYLHNFKGIVEGRGLPPLNPMECGREHSFLYTIYYYLVHPAEIRQYIEEDLAVGHTLLKRKYDWVKQNIFRGVEF